MTEEERRTAKPQSMTRRYRRGLILTGVLCVLAMLTAATVLFQRSYTERIDTYLADICDGYAAAYKAQGGGDLHLLVLTLQHPAKMEADTLQYSPDHFRLSRLELDIEKNSGRIGIFKRAPVSMKPWCENYAASPRSYF